MIGLAGKFLQPISALVHAGIASKQEDIEVREHA